MTLLDLSHNDFVCNDGVSYFLKMTESNFTPEVVGWDYGYSYLCTEADGTRVTFRDFAEGGMNLEEGYKPIETVVVEPVDYTKIIAPILSLIVVVPFVVILANAVYNNRYFDVPIILFYILILTMCCKKCTQFYTTTYDL